MAKQKMGFYKGVASTPFGKFDFAIYCGVGDTRKDARSTLACEFRVHLGQVEIDWFRGSNYHEEVTVKGLAGLKAARSEENSRHGYWMWSARSKA